MTSGSILATLTPHLSEPSPVIELPGLWTGSTLGAALLSVAGPVLNGSSVSLGLWETDLGRQVRRQQNLWQGVGSWGGGTELACSAGVQRGGACRDEVEGGGAGVQRGVQSREEQN